MKKIVTIFFHLAIVTIASHNLVDAQIPRTGSAMQYENTDDIVTISNISTRVSNLFVMDSLKSPHLASFEMALSPGDSKSILMSLLSAAQGNQSLKVSISKVNMQYQVLEQRDYNSAIVNEILISDINRSSKDMLTIKVKLLANDMFDGSDNNTSVSQLPPSSRGAMSGNFKISIGKLPTQRITSISGLGFSGQGYKGYLNFTVEVGLLDAKPWREWFNKGTESGRREDGIISLMDQTLSNEIAAFHLSDVEIVSVSESSSLQNIGKITVGLRARKLDFYK